MRIAVLRETAPGEARVALVPDVVQRLAKAGHQISIQRGAGLAAGFTDADYEKAGARVLESRAETLTGAELWAAVRRPTPAEIGEAPEGATLVSMLGVEPVDPLLPALAARRLTLLGLERVPRITRAQSMDVLSSQATVAGYKAVLARGGRARQAAPDAHHRRRDAGSGEGAGAGRGGRGAPGHRHGAAARGGGGRLRRPARGARAGPEPRGHASSARRCPPTTRARADMPGP